MKPLSDFGRGCDRRFAALPRSIATAGTVVLLLVVVALASAQDTAPTASTASRVEDIYVARSMRVGRSTTPSGFCVESRAGFSNAAFEDQYTFHSVAARTSDGRITDTNVATIGRLHACLGSQSNPVYGFFVEGALGGVTFTGHGECRTIKPDFPEAGLRETGCYLQLTDLPPGYAGGYLTTNTLGSREPLGDRSDPPGYTQNSIATIRLWKRR